MIFGLTKGWSRFKQLQNLSFTDHFWKSLFSSHRSIIKWYFFEFKKCGIFNLNLDGGEVLQKREQFCIKLRKEKKASILREKRAKLQAVDENGQSIYADESDKSEYNYSSYSRFRNEQGLLTFVLDECLPLHLTFKAGSVSLSSLTFVKVTHIKECIDALYQSQNFSQLQVLAIVSEIRKLVSCDELRVKEIIE